MWRKTLNNKAALTGGQKIKRNLYEYIGYSIIENSKNLACTEVWLKAICYNGSISAVILGEKDVS